MMLRFRFNSVDFSACVLLAQCTLLLSGCHLPYFPYPPFLKQYTASYELRSIDGIALDEESIAPPIRLEEAAADDGVAAENMAPEHALIEGTEPRTDGDVQESTISEAEELPPPPPESIDLSLADARAATLTSNLELQIELINPAIARQVVSQESARFEATFASSYVRNRADLPPGLAAGGEPDTTYDVFRNSITQPLIAGGEVRALHDVTKTDVHGLLVPNAVDTDLGVEYRQPLLRGFGYQVNTAGIQIARARTGVADARSKLTAIRAIAEVERAYWRLYAARRFYEIALQQLDLAERQNIVATRLVKAGVFTKVEELVAESGVLVRSDAAIQAETVVRLAERELKRIMQRPDAPVDSRTEIILVTEPNPLGLVFDRENLADRALENRMELLELQLLLVANAIEIEVQQNSILPRLDLSAELDALGLESSYRRSLESLFDNEFGDRLIGIALEVPLSGNIGARARLREAQLRRLQTQIETERVSVVIVQEVYDAIDLVEQNWERIVATRRARVASERAYAGQVRLQEAGNQTVTDVLVALANLGDARAQEVQAVVDYQIAKVDLALAAGAMLGYGQVAWSPCEGLQSPLTDIVGLRIPGAESTAGQSPIPMRLPPPTIPTGSAELTTSTPSASIEFSQE